MPSHLSSRYEAHALGGLYVSSSEGFWISMMMMDAGLPLVFLSVVVILYGVVLVLGTFVAGIVLDDRIARKQALEQYRILFLTCPCYVGRCYMRSIFWLLSHLLDR